MPYKIKPNAFYWDTTYQPEGFDMKQSPEHGVICDCAEILARNTDDTPKKI